MKGLGIALLVAVTLPYVASAEDESVQGVWELAFSEYLDNGDPHLDGYRGLAIYTDKHFCVLVHIPGRAKRDKPRAEFSREELLELARVSGFAGSYTVKGNRLVRHRTTVIDPRTEGLAQSRKFSIQDGILCIYGEDFDGRRFAASWKRVE